MKKKIFISFIFFLSILTFSCFFHYTSAKYIFNYTFKATNIKIDKKPYIEVLSISNNNKGYEKYANQTHQIKLTTKVTEKNIVINNFNNTNIYTFIDNKKINSTININLIEKKSNYIIYEILLSNLTNNGNLSIIFPEGIIQDNLNQKNDFLDYDTHIIIDNISPSANCEEISIENEQSKYIISSNESIRDFDSWIISDDKKTLSKNFSTPVIYPITITDFAGNTTEVFVNIQKAKNLMIYYANYNGYNVSKFESNGQISGKQAIIDNSNKKTEIIFTYLDGNIKNYILEGKIFDYTYWGENTSAICMYAEIPYHYGYSPGPNSWYNINGKNAVYALAKLCVQLGGQGHNSYNNSCLGTYNPIPKDIAIQNLYGISGIAFKLTNSDIYSIVYQIYVPNIGWLKAASDGEETTYLHNKPFSAIRINIVPTSEKNHLINYWNRNIYTNNSNLF